MLYHLSDIVENSVLLDSMITDDNNENKANNTAFMHSLYGIFRRNNEIYLTKTSTEEFLNGNRGTALRLYNIQSIKIEPSRHVGFAEKQLAPSVLDGSDISIADKIKVVNIYITTLEICIKIILAYAHIVQVFLQRDGEDRIALCKLDTDFTL